MAQLKRIHTNAGCQKTFGTHLYKETNQSVEYIIKKTPASQSPAHNYQTLSQPATQQSNNMMKDIHHYKDTEDISIL
jgi:hypothetical protein